MQIYRASQCVGMGLMLLVAGCAPQPAPTIPWWDSFPLAFEAAAEAGKPMLVYFNADWCTICRRLEGESFTAPAVAQALEPFIAVKVDIDRQPWIAEKYQIDAVPAYLKLDSAGKRLGHGLGYKSPEEITELLRTWSNETVAP